MRGFQLIFIRLKRTNSKRREKRRKRKKRFMVRIGFIVAIKID